jgi:hypothetical protein
MHGARTALICIGVACIVGRQAALGQSTANVVFDPKTKIGVVVWMNQKGAPSTRISLEIMHRLHGRFDVERFPVHENDDEAQKPAESELRHSNRF